MLIFSQFLRHFVVLRQMFRFFQKYLTANAKSPQSATVDSLIDGVEYVQELRNFSDFLEKCLKRPVLQYSIKPLPKFGENFGSALEALEVKLSKNNQSNEVSSHDKFENNQNCVLAEMILLL